MVRALAAEQLAALPHGGAAAGVRHGVHLQHEVARELPEHGDVARVTCLHDRAIPALRVVRTPGVFLTRSRKAGMLGM
ncbi:hypothetical protein GCM10022288_04330 [Gryllotalpicola kribbensis]|uniref:Uncharacterized protein n=1 Tax=Gryllotalpicola kribbensis TaxID=993084 RepID=A0ABP8AHK7_9MICO